MNKYLKAQLIGIDSLGALCWLEVDGERIRASLPIEPILELEINTDDFFLWSPKDLTAEILMD